MNINVSDSCMSKVLVPKFIKVVNKLFIYYYTVLDSKENANADS